jgi:hypothetical protein
MPEQPEAQIQENPSARFVVARVLTLTSVYTIPPLLFSFSLICYKPLSRIFVTEITQEIWNIFV